MLEWLMLNASVVGCVEHKAAVRRRTPRGRLLSRPAVKVLRSFADDPSPYRGFEPMLSCEVKSDEPANG
jgi:hypothetical protein